MSGANLPDIERGESLVSYGAGTYHVRARQPPQSRRLSLAIQPLNGASHLIDVTLQETAQGDLVFYQARTSIFRAAAGRWYKQCLMKVFTKCIVGTAKVLQVGRAPSDVCSISESNQPLTKKVMLCENESSHVYLCDFTKDIVLTEALNNPRVVFRSTNAGHESSLLDNSSIRALEDLKGHEIVVVQQIIDKANVARVLILLLIASPGLGIAIGLCSHNADAGIAASAGIFALASFTQGLIAWLQG